MARIEHGISAGESMENEAVRGKRLGFCACGCATGRREVKEEDSLGVGERNECEVAAR